MDLPAEHCNCLNDNSIRSNEVVKNDRLTKELLGEGRLWPAFPMAAEPKDKRANPLNAIRVAKLCININPGGVGDKVNQASRVIQQLTDQRAMLARSHRTIPKFGIRRNDKIAAYVTVRGPKALEILNRALQVKDYELKQHCFSDTGNFGFGIKEHIDLGIKYDREIGTHGLDIYVVLERPGSRVDRRKHCQSRIGHAQRVTKDEAKEWYLKTFPSAQLLTK
jgi:large subunit ribosomal protein L11e